jgi:hypothetical protein
MPGRKGVNHATQQAGGDRFFHHRELPLENTGVRPNRDTLYSQAVFDLDAGPVTITSPDVDVATWPQVIDEDHYVAGVVYDAGAHVHQ